MGGGNPLEQFYEEVIEDPYKKVKGEVEDEVRRIGREIRDPLDQEKMQAQAEAQQAAQEAALREEKKKLLEKQKKEKLIRDKEREDLAIARRGFLSLRRTGSRGVSGSQLNPNQRSSRRLLGN